MSSRTNRKIAKNKDRQKTMEKTMIFDEPHTPDPSTMRDYQKECLAAIEKAGPGSHLCVLATGLGKCFAPGTRVMMYDGSVKNIEDIKEKEQVMGPDGKPRLVVGLTHGFDNMYTVHQNKGMDYTVNSVHILSLKMTGMAHSIIGGDNKRYNSNDTFNISMSDYLKSSKTFKHCAKGWKPECLIFDDKEVLIDPYMLGVWLGDGSSSTPSITIADKDVELIEYCKEFAQKNSLDIHIREFSKEENAKLYYFVSKSRKHYSNIFNKIFKEYDLYKNKHIPKQFLFNNEKIRHLVLAGLLDTDGSLIDKSVYEITTVSNQLKDDIVFLARSLGYYVSCNNKIVKGKKYYRINISGNTEKIPCRVARKKAVERKQKKDVLKTGIMVKSAGYGEYYGFELVGPDRLFLLEDFTVVHNTYIFSHLPRYGRVLLLSHRDELVHQPEKYYDCSFGVEQAGEHSNGEEVVSASVQTLIRRLDKFDPYDFDMIITDEAHHAVAKSYQKIYDYFKPRIHIGFTATPDRADKNDLNKIFNDIIYYKDIKFGIKNNYLCDVDCLRINIGYDLRKVHKQMGDFKLNELGNEMEQPEVVDAIAEAYNKYAKGATMIFAVNVSHAEKIAEKIPGAVVVTGKTPNRAEIIQDFTDRKIPCIVNCMVFTEGTDIPLIETIIMARPTSNHSLYSQMVGRGLRLYPGKDMLRLIDCVGVTGRLDICTAPNLFGLGTDVVEEQNKTKIQGKLSEMPDLIEELADTPRSWIINAERVSLISKEEGVNIDNINYILMPDMSLKVSAGNGIDVIVPQSDARGQTVAAICKGGQVIHRHILEDKQKVLDDVNDYLSTYCASSRPLWDKTSSGWGNNPSTEKQINFIKRLMAQAHRQWDPSLSNMTKREASIVIERLKYEIQQKYSA